MRSWTKTSVVLLLSPVNQIAGIKNERHVAPVGADRGTKAVDISLSAAGIEAHQFGCPRGAVVDENIDGPRCRRPSPDCWHQK